MPPAPILTFVQAVTDMIYMTYASIYIKFFKPLPSVTGCGGSEGSEKVLQGRKVVVRKGNVGGPLGTKSVAMGVEDRGLTLGVSK